MNVNFGLFPPFPKSAKIRGKDRKQAMSARALEDLSGWLGDKQAAE
jgi:methylenetetrahydrofolate--tRNA-(uracil-5-)-methyltransferase